jgi:VanZ family protein
VKKAPVRFSRLAYLWAPVFLYAAFIFFLSSLSFGHPLFQRAEKNHVDKLAHIVEYTLFGYLLARALWRHSPIWGSSARVFAAVLLAGALYAASDEWHQRWVPLRDPAAQDLAADVAGLACGAWLWMRKQGHINA